MTPSSSMAGEVVIFGFVLHYSVLRGEDTDMVLSICSVVNCEVQIQEEKEKTNSKPQVKLSFKTYLKTLYFREVTIGRGQAAIIGVQHVITVG